MRRLPEQPGEWIDRSQRIDFRFEGRSYQGFRGDVLNSALLANGIRVVGRSFKYHRPRGVYSLANHDANGLFCAAGHVHLRGDLVPLGEGLDFKAVNTRGGVAGDWLRFTQLFSRFLPVGFYYKAFFKPRWAFPFHERMFRELAGLGAITPSAPAPNSPKDYAWCDVLVVGSGASGLAAAEAAAECGAKVLLVEEQPRIGGSLHWQREDGDPTQELADYR
ncbi:MAG: FAD-dependent oxidoreductase, partial [Akkermansiaceae bacterium]|nr:FAD-dependent oxidoreductase [Akkermansiaceae bacterium]